ncbi:MAG: C1 family peptidase [Polyangiaceae bacterium]|nr:C1 family peptidase [Polyangiaceae bacterium]
MSAFAAVPTGSLPATVDHRVDGTEGPVKNQQSVGSCTAFSLSTAMDQALRKTTRDQAVSPLHIWSKYGRPSMGHAGDSNVGELISTEGVWPYDPKKACQLTKDRTDSCGVAYGVTPGSAANDEEIRYDQARADSMGQYKLEAYEQISSPVNTDEIAAVLAGGDDLWVAFRVNTQAWYTPNGGKKDVIPDYSTTESTGHAVVLAGYRTVQGKRQFLIHNSWGESWGDRGYAWISEQMVRNQLKYGYKVRVSGGSGPSPNPPNQSDCPPGQVKDSVLRKCTNPCPSGSPPAAGVCLPKVPVPVPTPTNTQPNSKCPPGQAQDPITGICTALCPGGYPSIGGLCLPVRR